MNPLLLVPVLLLADQALKVYIHSNFPPGWSVPLIPGVIELTYLRNTGAAFGFFPQYTEVLVVISLISVLAILFYYRRIPREKGFLRLGLSLGLTGALGNLVDRSLYGYVVDMFDLRFWPGVFNLADLAIVLGVTLIIIELWRDSVQEEGA